MSGPKKHIFPSGVDLKKSELLNARLQHLFSFPIDPEEGQIIYRSDLELGAFWNGSKWVFFGMPPNGEPYPTAADLYADQANQEVWYQYLVTGEEKIYIYLGTTTGDQTDYVVVGGGAQTLAEVLDLGNTSGPNDIEFDTGQGLIFANTSRLREGTIDAGLGGTKGIAQICAVGYELKWEAGRLYVMNGDGTGIRWSLYNFTTTPTIDDDTTKGYGIGSRWVLDDGTVYVCSDATTGAAVWAISGGGISDAPNDGLAYTRKNLAWAQSSPYDLKQEGATDGQVLAWSTANSRFQPTTPSAGGNFIAYDVSQSLTSLQKATARTNIGSSASIPQVITTTGAINDLVITSNCIIFTGAGAVTLSGIVPDYDGQELSIINRTGNVLTILTSSILSSVSNRFFGGILILDYQSVVYKYSSVVGRWINLTGGIFPSQGSVLGLRVSNVIGFNDDPANAVTATFKSKSGASWAARFLNSSGVSVFNVPESGLCDFPSGLGVRVGASANIGITARAPSAGTWALALYTFAGANGAFVNNSMEWMSIGGASFGIGAVSAPTARVDIRGRGTTTGNTLLLEDSAGTDNALFLDNGQIRFLRLPTASAGLAAGSLWNDSGTIKIV